MFGRLLTLLVTILFIVGITNVSPAMNAQDISNYQKNLKTLGYYKAEPTGEMDEATVQAIKECQRRCGLEPTGKLDEKTCGAIMKEMEQKKAPAEKGMEREGTK